MRIAILDNDLHQRALIAETLAADRQDCEVFDQVSSLLAKLRDSDSDIDLLVFHWQPESEGLRQLAEIRQMKPALPILLLTARAQERELAAALATGCSDYLVKPLRRTELRLRVQVLSARAHPGQLNAPTLDFGAYAFDVRGARLTLQGKPIALTQKEFDLAMLFFRNLGRPLSRATILEAVWPQDAEFSSRSMDTHVSRVRNKLKLRPENGFRLAPVYSYGYCLEQLVGESE